MIGFQCWPALIPNFTVMKKYLIPLLAIAVLVITTGASYVSAAAYDWHVASQDSLNAPITTDIAPRGEHELLGHLNGTNEPFFFGVDGTSLVLDTSEHHLEIGYIGSDRVTGLDASLADHASRLTSLETLPSIVASHTSTISTINALDAAINANLIGSSTTMLAQSASSTNGLMTKAQSNKLDALQGGQAWSWSQPSRSLTTSTGATGFQPSSSRVSTINYNVTVSTTATIGGNSGGYIALEVAPTNSATAGDWVEMGRCGNSQNISLAIVLQSVQTVSCQVSADVPAGYYAKLRSVTVAGTPAFTFNTSSEILK